MTTSVMGAGKGHKQAVGKEGMVVGIFDRDRISSLALQLRKAFFIWK